mmetsp:Transcript_52084/g.160447  ORF Transcript_52084/g.160447 Transcript_52084/m.160447 type:complete len:228 (+) Transcript_52084:589-1272(+)
MLGAEQHDGAVPLRAEHVARGQGVGGDGHVRRPADAGGDDGARRGVVDGDPREADYRQQLDDADAPHVLRAVRHDDYREPDRPVAADGRVVPRRRRHARRQAPGRGAVRLGHGGHGRRAGPRGDGAGGPGRLHPRHVELRKLAAVPRGARRVRHVLGAELHVGAGRDARGVQQGGIQLRCPHHQRDCPALSGVLVSSSEGAHRPMPARVNSPQPVTPGGDSNMTNDP